MQYLTRRLHNEDHIWIGDSSALVGIAGYMVESDPNEVWAEELHEEEIGDPELGARIAAAKINVAEGAGIDVNSLSIQRAMGHAAETIHTTDPITGEINTRF
jgi:hypothetical protein